MYTILATDRDDMTARPVGIFETMKEAEAVMELMEERQKIRLLEEAENWMPHARHAFSEPVEDAPRVVRRTARKIGVTVAELYTMGAEAQRQIAILMAEDEADDLYEFTVVEIGHPSDYDKND